MSKEKMKAYPVRLPEETLRKIDVLAECVFYESRSEIMRRAIAHMLALHKGQIARIDQNQGEVKP